MDNSALDGCFLTMLNEHRGAIQRVTRTYTTNLGDREDLVQEIVYQLWRAFPAYRRESKSVTWVYRIAVNLCKNRVKYLARRYADAQDELEPIADRSLLGDAKAVTYGAVARPDQMVEGFQVEQIVHRAMAQLEPDFREVLILRDVEDLSYEEIVEITGLAEGTVKSRIHRGRTMLKALVEASLGEKIG